MSTDLDRAAEAAWAAQNRHDWVEAIVHWEECLRIDPTNVTACWMGGVLMLGQKRLAEGEAVLAQGLVVEPGHVLMAVEHAKAAVFQMHWPDAVRRFGVLQERAADINEVQVALKDAVMQMQMRGINTAADAGVTQAEWVRFCGLRATASDTDLFMRFESIGDNCEFGLTQRHFGAEPLSLLRWNSIEIDHLIASLADGFSNVGDPDHTIMVDALNEYVLRDARYGMSMHTFINVELCIEDPAELRTKMCRRLAYLGRKLIEDLEDPDQIFVFKTIQGTTLEKVRELHETMERYGPNRLLYVREADADHPAGFVSEIAPRLYVGVIASVIKGDMNWQQIDFDGWRNLCRQVIELSEPDTAPPEAELAPAIKAVTPVPHPLVEPDASIPLTSWDILRGKGPPAPPPPAPRQGLFSRIFKSGR